MPRASYSDKYTVTVQQGEKHVAFDFTSRVSIFYIYNLNHFLDFKLQFLSFGIVEVFLTIFCIV